MYENIRVPPWDRIMLSVVMALWLGKLTILNDVR